MALTWVIKKDAKFQLSKYDSVCQTQLNLFINYY